MKATIIVGSGTGGFTDSQCTALAARMERSGWTCAVHRPIDMDIGDCRGCQRCRTQGVCVMDDGMSAVIGDFMDSDAVVFSSPVRFSNLSSVMKRVMDRFQPYWDTETVYRRKRRLALLMNGGSECPCTEPAERSVRAFCLSMNCEYVGCWLMSDTDRVPFPDQDMDAVSESIIGALSP